MSEEPRTTVQLSWGTFPSREEFDQAFAAEMAAEVLGQ